MSSSTASARGSFASSSALSRCSNGSPFGHVIWCGPGDAKVLEPQFRVGSITGADYGQPGVVVCTPDNLKRTLNSTRFIVGIAVVEQSAQVSRDCLFQVRGHCYFHGLGCPVYATTARAADQDALYDVADVVGTDRDEIIQGMQNKFDAAPIEKLDIVWCDPAYASSLMISKVRELENLGMSVTLCGSEDELVHQVTDACFAVVVTGRTRGAIAKIRRKIKEDSSRPLFWFVSLSASPTECYQAGADAAIVNNNKSLEEHKRHILSTMPNDPWLWSIVVGDIKSNIVRMGVAGMGGTHWSFPKQWDNSDWLQSNFRTFSGKMDDLFRQVAARHNILVQDVTPVMRDSAEFRDHSNKFAAAKAQVAGYVCDGLVFHGTSVEVAQQIMKTGFLPSTTGMYGPGVYAVDITGVAKALFFAMSKAKPGSIRRGDRTAQKVGAVIGMRIGFSKVAPVVELPGGSWFNASTPDSNADCIMGTAPAGYGGAKCFWTEKDQDLNDIPEFVIRNPNLVTPLFMATYTS